MKTTRFSPLYLKNKKVLPNRIIVPPMASETSDSKGYVSQKTVDHYSNLAKSGAGLVMVEYSFVHQSGRSEEFQLGIDQDDQIQGLSEISKAIKDSGPMAGIQLTHSGGKTESQFTEGVLQSPSGIVVPVKDKELEAPEVMTSAEIKKWKEWFLAASDRAARAGFELIELHAAHGYGINQWLSPVTNKRDDDYGGSIENNSRLLLEIISDIKLAHPQLLISIRMPGQDFLSGGLIPEDCILIAKLLENAGVDILNISSGIGGWRRPSNRTGEGYLVEEAALIQANVSIPVIGVGGIETGLYIDQILNDNKISLVAVGRAILKDPLSWGQNQLGSTYA